MIRLDRTATIAARPEDAFAYVANFANVAQWDPGVVSSEKTTEGVIGVGTAFHVVARFLGAAVPMDYRITEWDPPNRVELYGRAATVDAIDRITFESDGDGGTHIRYEAEFTFRVGRRLADRVMRRVFEHVGDKAMAGLEAATIPRAAGIRPDGA